MTKVYTASNGRKYIKTDKGRARFISNAKYQELTKKKNNTNDKENNILRAMKETEPEKKPKRKYKRKTKKCECDL